jgi:hypothetical protein
MIFNRSEFSGGDLSVPVEVDEFKGSIGPARRPIVRPCGGSTTIW